MNTVPSAGAANSCGADHRGLNDTVPRVQEKLDDCLSTVLKSWAVSDSYHHIISSQVLDRDSP